MEQAYGRSQGARRVVRWSVRGALAALGASLVFATAAFSDTTVGATGGGLGCGGTGEFADAGYVVPAGGGVITSLSLQTTGSDNGSNIDLNVLRHVSGSTYTVVGDTQLVTLTGSGLETFPANIPVTGGEILGHYQEAFLSSCLRFSSGTALVGPTSGDPQPGTSVDLPLAFAGYSANESANLHPTAAALSATGTPVTATEGRSVSGPVAAFSDTDNQPAGAYSATIDWGDGQSSAATVTLTGTGQYAVSGSNTYAEEGSYPVSVEISDADGTSTTVSTTATVADASLAADGLGSPAAPIATTSTFAGPIAHFTDSNSGASVSDFAATIDWGDGTSSGGTVSGDGGSYSVGASHTYAATGPHTITTHIVDGGGSHAEATTYALGYGRADATGGSFVVGDVGAGPVYYWGPQWARHNMAGTGNAPDAFKGFADSSGTSCGSAFSARPGKSSAPAPTVPAYMSVVVAGSVSKSGSVISGTIQKLIVVKTDSGSPGTGRVVATICG